MTSRVERINSAVDSGLGVVRHTITAAVDAFEDCFASIAIPGADAAIALLAAQNMVQQLGFSLGVAIITGVSLEGVGLVANRAALRCRYYNQTHKSEPPALEKLAWSLLVMNFLIGIVLVVANTVWIGGMMWGVISVAFLGSIGTLAHVIENDVKARETSAKPAASLAPAAPLASNAVAESFTLDAPVAPLATTRDRVLAFYRENPSATQEAAALAVGVNRSRIGQILKELEDKKIISRNGHVEVLAASEEGR